MPPAEIQASPLHGYTVSEVATHYRVGEDKVRAWIKSGLLRAINTADVKCAKPRYVVPPEPLPQLPGVLADDPVKRLQVAAQHIAPGEPAGRVVVFDTRGAKVLDVTVPLGVTAAEPYASAL